MLAFRLARGTHPLVLLRRLMVAAASAGVGFLLLCTLTYALAHPADSGSALRLLWCLIPAAATVQFAVAVARTDPSTRPRQGLSAVGLGPARLTALAAVSTAVAGTLGSMVALLFFLHLRGDLTGLPFDGAAAEPLAADQPLPLAAALTLLALVPLAATAAAALALRPRRVKPGTEPDAQDAPAPTPTGLPWGVALTAAGLAVGTYASRGGPGSALPLPGQFDGSPAGVLAGWALTALGLAFAGPRITHFCGLVLQSARPRATRLLAGRILMEESRRIGRPLGVVCSVASAAIAAPTVYGDTGPNLVGPLTGLGAALVITCTTATLLTSALEAKQARAHTTKALRRLGAPTSALRHATALRVATLLAVFAPLTWGVAALAALPLSA
ncbi:hypothetical protein HRW16_08390 [Streptomyces lunaelactis]|uniref:hypothetical protein n=1 Tax=Streptomyces lunaelactis TaxID=1535768 RepID=UPI0015852961|nr:hypothetical protein [Streptomyces lunaelactis]NUK02766.1 hypothetical protein [Streptomyces lunaelactis]NUK20252.1 hypothetical protein [Streptomyces lunaelactis]NUK34074.1 hypothetical protein [Streptomyces lunaelactis]NUK42173.1 hypothetical protein [Streptomyces lunaelactis]NUK61827.1 hypothetical protein [Streptomyces lunaelactis]